MGLRPLPILAPALLVVLWSVPAMAGRSVSLYLDGAVVERDETAKNGYLEFPLPPSVRPESLRIRPVGSARIARVQTVTREPDRKAAKELAAITERQEILQDRLKALAVREEIFRAAAKSQSAKAPKRSKANPEPLATIRQGTDYAISQLESVYRSQRTVSSELKTLEEKRARVLRESQAGGTVARVWLTPARGSATATYIQTDRLWQPRYELRVTGADKARLAIFPGEITRQHGEEVAVHLAPVNSGVKTSSWPYRDRSEPVAEMELPAQGKSEIAGAVPVVKLSLSNTSGAAIPSGAFSCFCDGVYHGSGRLALLEPGSVVEVQCGSN